MSIALFHTAVHPPPAHQKTRISYEEYQKRKATHQVLQVEKEPQSVDAARPGEFAQLLYDL